MGAGDSLEALQNSWKGVALGGGGLRGSLGRNPGRVLHLAKGSPLSGSLSQGEGPQVRRSLDHSWKPGAILGWGGGEGQEGYCFSKPNLGCPKNPSGPSPQSAGQSLGQMENHSACKDTINVRGVKYCSSSFSIANTAQEPLFQEQRPQGKAVPSPAVQRQSCGPS